MPPTIDATVSTYGAYEPGRIARIFSAASPRLWGMFAATLICGAAVFLGGCVADPAAAVAPAEASTVRTNAVGVAGNNYRREVTRVIDSKHDAVCYAITGYDNSAISCVRGQ